MGTEDFIITDSSDCVLWNINKLKLSGPLDLESNKYERKVNVPLVLESNRYVREVKDTLFFLESNKYVRKVKDHFLYHEAYWFFDANPLC